MDNEEFIPFLSYACMYVRIIHCFGVAGTGNWVNQMTNFKYKFLMSIDGNTFVSRLPLFLSSGSVPFRAGIYSEWFDEWIKENEHYIQIKLDYSDLDYKLQWALDHDDKMRAIGQRARRFAKTRLRNEDMECYLYRLLLEYAAMVFWFLVNLSACGQNYPLC